MEKLLLVTPQIEDFDDHIIHLRSEGFELHHEENEDNILSRLEEEVFSGVLFSDRWKQNVKVCSEVKEKTKLPVFMISKHGSQKDAVNVLKKGVFCLPGEISPLYTSSIIRMYIDEKGKRESEDACDIEVKESTQQFFVRGELVECTAQTYRLWRYLLEKGSDISPVDEIYRDVWKEDTLLGYERTVRVHINKIKKCIPEELRDVCFIENIRGKGYRFIGTFRTIKSFFFI